MGGVGRAVDVGNGVLDDVQRLYLATGLTSTPTNFDAGRKDIAIVWKPFHEAITNGYGWDNNGGMQHRGDPARRDTAASEET